MSNYFHSPNTSDRWNVSVIIVIILNLLTLMDFGKTFEIDFLQYRNVSLYKPPLPHTILRNNFIIS